MATKLDLVQIKENIKGFFDDANTSTASANLSADMTNEVKNIFMVNPEKIQVDASRYPYITSFIVSKRPENKDIAPGYNRGARQAVVTVRIVGGVWNNTFVDAATDPADNDIEHLMENAELVLRGQDNFLSGYTTMQNISDVEYYNFSKDEANHLRFGVMDLDLNIFY